MADSSLTTPGGGYVSSDEAIRRRVAEMSAAAGGSAPAPAPTNPSIPTSTPATATSPGYSTPPPPYDPASLRGARENPLYIGPTNFGTLQQKYTPYQIEQATTRNATGDIFWKQGVDINQVPRNAPTAAFQAPQAPTTPTGADLTRGAAVSTTGAITTPTAGNEFAQAQSQAAQQYLTGIQKTLDDLAARQQAEETAKKVQAEQNVKSLTDRIRGFFDSTAIQDTLKRDRELFKVKENIDTLNTIRGKIADASAALDQGILYEESRPVRMQLLTGRSAELKRQGIAGIGALQAAAEVVKGNIELARAYADDTISAMKTDIAYQNDAVKTLLGLEQDNLIRLSKDERDTINYRQKLLEDEGKRLDKQKDDLLDLAIKYPSAFARGGVTFADSREAAVQKMLPTMSAQEKEKYDLEIQETQAKIAATKAAAAKRAKDNNTRTGNLSNYDSLLRQLNASKGSDGYVNTDEYKRLRGTLGKSFLKTEFDRNFANLLNPNDRTAVSFINAKVQQDIGTYRYNEQNIPADFRNDILKNLNNPVEDVIAAFPEVDSSYITKLHKAANE